MAAHFIPGHMQVDTQAKTIVTEWLEKKYLTYDDYHGDDTLSISVRDFLNITTTSDSGKPHLSWLTDDSLTLPLLYRAECEADDILILPPSTSQTVAAIALGDLDANDLHRDLPQWFDNIRNNDFRWIIVPCNDGMISQAGEDANADDSGDDFASGYANDVALTPAEADTIMEDGEEIAITSPARPRKVRLTPAKKTPKPDVTQGGAIGAHWGFMIIDKEENAARWFDGHLTLEKKNGRTVISHMFGAGRAAGKVLRGIELVFGQQDRQFDASTLKFVPNDHSHNRFRGDQGAACGPWVFAMLHHMFTRQQFFTRANDFDRVFLEGKQQKHAHSLAFDSRNTRRQMQQLIADEAEENPYDADLPHKLDDGVLKALGINFNIGVLRNAVGIFESIHGDEPAQKSTKRSGDSKSGSIGDDDDAESEDGGARGTPEQDEESQAAQNKRNGLRRKVSEKIKSVTGATDELNSCRQAIGRTDQPKPIRSGSKKTAKSHEVAAVPGFNVPVDPNWLKSHTVDFSQVSREMFRKFNKLVKAKKGVKRGAPEKDGKTYLVTKHGDWEHRAVLQETYGGIDRLTDAQLQHWARTDSTIDKSSSTAICKAFRSKTVGFHILDIDVEDPSLYPPEYLASHGFNVNPPTENAKKSGKKTTASPAKAQKASKSSKPVEKLVKDGRVTKKTGAGKTPSKVVKQASIMKGLAQEEATNATAETPATQQPTDPAPDDASESPTSAAPPPATPASARSPARATSSPSSHITVQNSGSSASPAGSSNGTAAAGQHNSRKRKTPPTDEHSPSKRVTTSPPPSSAGA